MGRAYAHGLDPKEARPRDSEVVWRVSRNVLNYTSTSYRTAGNARVDAPGPECYPSHVSLRRLERPPQRLRAQEINPIFSFSNRFAYSWYPRLTSKALPVKHSGEHRGWAGLAVSLEEKKGLTTHPEA
jgi:hypothetical protein